MELLRPCGLRAFNAAPLHVKQPPAWHGLRCIVVSVNDILPFSRHGKNGIIKVLHGRFLSIGHPSDARPGEHHWTHKSMGFIKYDSISLQGTVLCLLEEHSHHLCIISSGEAHGSSFATAVGADHQQMAIEALNALSTSCRRYAGAAPRQIAPVMSSAQIVNTLIT